MKILDNGIVRDMTAEEEAAFLNTPISDEEALTRYANELTGADDPDLISAAETMITKLARED